MGANITKELQEVLKKNPKIKKVYFNEDGQHFFSKFDIELHETDGEGFSTGVVKVSTLPGAKKTAVKIVVDRKKGKVIDKFVNTSYVKIATELSREQVLKATPAATDMSEEKKIETLRLAAEIMNDKSNMGLLKSLKLG